MNPKLCTTDKRDAVKHLPFQLIAYQRFSTQSMAVQSPALDKAFYSVGFHIIEAELQLDL